MGTKRARQAPKPGHAPDARDERLAAALRANLRRRKAGSALRTPAEGASPAHPPLGDGGEPG